MAHVLVTVEGPYDLELSLRAMASFSPESPGDPSVLRTPVRIGGKPAIVEMKQVQRAPAVLEASSRGIRSSARLRETAEWLLLADLDLRPFYRIAARHRVLGPIVRRLRGLRPMRPASLFEMAVIAVTEQQLSLTAARRIRSRVVERFGERLDGEWFFPEVGALAKARLESLRSCGLSARKAEYIRDFARLVAAGSFDLDRLKLMGDDDVRSAVVGVRGFGLWSAEYILIRGLGRPDVVPADDLGIRTITGKYLGAGGRMTAAEVRGALRPFAPYRGIAAFYLLVAERLLSGGPGGS